MQEPSEASASSSTTKTPAEVKKTDIACSNCRKRKIRCDGRKPSCGYCTRQYKECEYATIINRRGRDRVAGSRRSRAVEKAPSDAPAEQRATKTPSSSTSPSASVASSTVHLPSLSTAGPSHPSPSSADSESRGRSAFSAEYLSPPRSVPSTQERAGSVRLSSSPGTLTLPPLPAISSMDTLRTNFSISSASSSSSTHSLRAVSQDASPTLTSPAHFAQTARGGSEVFSSPPVLSAQVISLDESEDDRHAEDEQTNNASASTSTATTTTTGAVSAGPSATLAKQTWWDTVLTYHGPDREASAKRICASLVSVFTISHSWMSFMNVPLFFATLHDPVGRHYMQPSLVLALLALSELQESNELEHGEAGRYRALWLRDAAQSALEASLNTLWIESTLVHAAFILAFFEICAHPLHSRDRCRSSILLVDALVQSLSLTCMDASDPRTSVFPAGHLASLPAIPSPSSPSSDNPDTPTNANINTPSCTCESFYFSSPGKADCIAKGQNSLHRQTVTEIRKEENRRMVWSAMQAFAAYTAKEVEFGYGFLPLFITEPFNYSIMFPGESELLQISSAFHSHENIQHQQYIAKGSVSALYCRLMLLWCSCLRLKHNALLGFDSEDYSPEEIEKRRAEFAIRAWSESMVIEEALERHTCQKDQLAIFATRNWIFGVRMLISHDFSWFNPKTGVHASFNRESIEEWIRQQLIVAKQTVKGLVTSLPLKPESLARKPTFGFWLESQIQRCLALFQMDPSLTASLDLCKALLPSVELLAGLWPCAAQRIRFLELLERIDIACLDAGVPLPPKPNFSLKPNPATAAAY